MLSISCSMKNHLVEFNETQFYKTVTTASVLQTLTSFGRNRSGVFEKNILPSTL